MSSDASPSDGPELPAEVDLEGLLCALVLAPHTFSRNRFFGMFQRAEARAVRRRAARVRGLIRQVLGQGRPKGDITGEQVLEDGQVLIKVCVPELTFERTTALSPLEAAVLRYALHRAGAGELSRSDRQSVENALARLAPELDAEGGSRD